METTENVEITEEPSHKKGRHRKKQLYTKILQQMEFYFSDSNLAKDRFLSQLIQETPAVDLSVFLKFNKLRKLTTNLTDIQKALKNSQLLELSEDKSTVSRKLPVKEKTNVDECTIYVERLKSDATHDWVQQVFAEFGNVVYVSIPKYKHNGAIKGFAFIEYDNEQEAQNALSYFEGIGCKMPSDLDPDQLCSIKTFEKKEGTKRKIEGDEEFKPKRLKVESAEPEAVEDTESKKKQKRKKEAKKEKYIKDLALQVLSKKEWKKMRNKYLDLQKKKMKEFKKHLHRARFSQCNYSEEKKEIVVPDPKVKPLDFVEGAIVKVTLDQPPEDPKKTKGDIKALSSDIKFVDIPNPGSSEIYIRTGSNKSALELSQNTSLPGHNTILGGDDEKSYWSKILDDKRTKFEKDKLNKKRKERGRDKLLKKANKINATHIKFDD